jgi:hypothetical protein
MQRSLIVIVFAVGLAGCAGRVARLNNVEPGDPRFAGMMHVVAALPAFDAYSATHDSTLASVFALVGTVADLESGQPLHYSEIIIRRASDGKIVSTLTDARGGFILARIPPGQYGLIVRRVGYVPLTDLRTADPGMIDTLRLKMSQAHDRLQGGAGRRVAFR